MRINKFLSFRGVCSRRTADKLVSSGRVSINNETASLGSMVLDSDKVCIDGKAVEEIPKKIYIIYNKPVGVICSSDETLPDNIISKINIKERVFPVGRLDVASSGAIFLTNDGDFSNKVMHPKFEHEKEYEVVIDKDITADFLQKISSGVEILGKLTNKCNVKKIEDKKFRVVLRQGMNRQIRRMCEALDCQVKSLKRLRILNISVENMKVGEYRHIKDVELTQLLQKINHGVIK